MDLDAIEHAAQAATSGEWRWDRETGTLDSLQDERSHVVTVACAEDGRVDISEDDAKFVVTCQPSAAREMAAEIRRLRVALKEACDIAARSLSAQGLISTWLDEQYDRIAELRKLAEP